MQYVNMYKCEHCKKLFNKEFDCLVHEARHTHPEFTANDKIMLKIKDTIATKNVLVSKDGVFSVYSFLENAPESVIDECVRAVIIDEVGEGYFTDNELNAIVDETCENGEYSFEGRRFEVFVVDCI